MSTARLIYLDPIDTDWAAIFKWSRARYPYRWQQRTIYLHREVAVRAGILDSYDDTREIDHINRNKYDSRRSNLRVASRSLNAVNSVRCTNTSGIANVQRKRNRWMVAMTRDGVRIQKYGFATREEAHAWLLANDPWRENA